MYPAKMVPGCRVFIKTSATSDRQARLLLQSFGVPFYGEVRN
jgi:large subunit ribosomal protein L5